MTHKTLVRRLRELLKNPDNIIQDEGPIWEARSLLEDLETFVDAVINSYDDAGCDGCGVVDQSINEKALALRERLQRDV